MTRKRRRETSNTQNQENTRNKTWENTGAKKTQDEARRNSKIPDLGKTTGKNSPGISRVAKHEELKQLEATARSERTRGKNNKKQQQGADMIWQRTEEKQTD